MVTIFRIFFGGLLILAGGLLGTEQLSLQQPSLKGPLHHLEAYRESLGLLNVCVGLFGLFESCSTLASTTFSPLYWILYTAHSLLAVCVGIFLSIRLLNPYLENGPAWLHRGVITLSLEVDQRANRLCWWALTLGLWRSLSALVA